MDTHGTRDSKRVRRRFFVSLPQELFGNCIEWIPITEQLTCREISKSFNQLVRSLLHQTSWLDLSSNAIPEPRLHRGLSFILDFCTWTRVVDFTGQTSITENDIIDTIKRRGETLEQIIMPRPTLEDTRPTALLGNQRWIESSVWLMKKKDREFFDPEIELVDGTVEFIAPVTSSAESARRSVDEILGEWPLSFTGNILHMAIKAGSIPFVKNLLDKGQCSVTDEDLYGRNAVELAIQSCQADILRTLLQDYNSKWNFAHAAEAMRLQSIEIMKTLLRHGQPSKPISFFEWNTILRWVVTTMDGNLLEVLTEFGIHQSIVDLRDVPQILSHAHRMWYKLGYIRGHPSAS